MKNLAKSIIAAAMIVVSASSFTSAAVIGSPVEANPLKYVKATTMVDVYLDAVTKGQDVDLAKYLFEDGFTQTFHGKRTKATHQKKEIVKYIESNKGYNYNCTTSYSVLEDQDIYTVVKATLNFENFTRVDMLTMQKTEDGWKISKIDVTYP